MYVILYVCMSSTFFPICLPPSYHPSLLPFSPPPSEPTLLPPSPPPSGINPVLVSMCVEYLHQPLALREEGLFRVPGDNSLMKSMHKDFQSGTASKEYLR